MKKTSIRLLMLLLLCLAGCGVTEKEGEEGVKVVSPAPTISISDIFQPEATPGVVDMDSFEVMAEDLKKEDVANLADYNAANRMLKHNAEQSQNSLFCIDGDTGVIYFVNQKQDYYIYRLKDGVAELAVPLPAKELYCWDGVLYFMIESYNRYELQGMKEWDIYAYHPAEGVVEVVYAVGELMENVTEGLEHKQRLTVNENGIYFIGGMKTEQVEFNGRVLTVTEEEGWHLPFGTTEPIIDDKKMTYTGWKDYYFGYTYAVDESGLNVTLIPRVQKKIEDNIIIGQANRFFLLEDAVYLLEGQKITKVNLLTEERTEYDCEPILRKNDNRFIGELSLPDLFTFTITEDSIWAFNSANYAVRFDRSSGEASCYKLGVTITEETVYTDGHSVYVLTTSGVAKILTEEVEGDSTEVTRLEAELLVK